MFTFLVGWPYIFEYTYDISQGLTNIIFISMFIGMQCVDLLSLDDTTNSQVKFSPELRLWYAMLGPAVAIPVSLFWLGWTANPSISIWSAILAAFLFGFGITGVFISTYLYIIDSYEVYSASALTFVSLVCYIAAGGMSVVGIPWYENMGVSHTLTILACISVLLVPIPYLLFFYGHHLRAKSKYAVSWE
ncbi:hypothetical protein CEP53_001735 [Fusarium sp. AF-6]|nr:hypothetical protein CEP53_001735 [Fusarium sp. AF-6]